MGTILEYKSREGTVLESMPDKHGTPVAVGDFVRNKFGEVWRVYGLRPREGHLEGDPNAKTGELDLLYSGFDIERPAEISELTLSFGSLEPVSQTGVSIPNAERVDDPELIAEFERRSITNAWRMIDHWEGRLATKRSSLQRREAELKEGAN